MKKQQTEWLWRYVGDAKTGIRVGWIHNKQRGVKEDVIRVQINSLSCNLDFSMRPDEASGLVCGIGRVLCIQFIKGRLRKSERRTKNE